MPNLKSNQKRLRQRVKKTAINRRWKDRVRAATKQVYADPTLENRARVQKLIDKAAKVGVFHESKASRLKSHILRAPARS